MSEFSAFLAGLILGDTSAPSDPKHKKNTIKKNVALQDVAFCQALRNTIDRLDDFVREKHPSPQDFITYLLPQYDFAEPYTSKEQKLIEEREQVIQKYVAWIDERVSCGELTGESSWENLTAIKMIWQDETHTPDPDHLDLLFGTCGITKPIKRDGRVYEYDTYFEPFNGIAKGFFSTVAAHVIQPLCIEAARSILAQEGFELDYRRLEYNAFADKRNSMEAWKLLERRKAYNLLLEKHNEFCGVAWSDETRKLKKERDDKSLRDKLPEDEIKRRNCEIKLVVKAMTKDERKAYENINANVVLGLAIFFAIALVVSLIVPFILSFDADFELREKLIHFTAVMLCITVVYFILLFTCPAVFFIVFYPLVLLARPSAIREALISLQTAYYENPDSPGGRKYAELLSRIKK